MSTNWGYFLFLGIFILSVAVPIRRYFLLRRKLQQFRERRVVNPGRYMISMRELPTNTLLLTQMEDSQWGIPEYSLWSDLKRAATYWMGPDDLVEAETAEGRWVFSPKSLEIHLASPRGDVAGPSRAVFYPSILKLPRGRAFHWKRTSSWWSTGQWNVLGFSGHLGHRAWALLDKTGNELVTCDEEGRLQIEPKAMAMPELTLLVLFAGLSAIRELYFTADD